MKTHSVVYLVQFVTSRKLWRKSVPNERERERLDGQRGPRSDRTARSFIRRDRIYGAGGRCMRYIPVGGLRLRTYGVLLASPSNIGGI